MWGSSSVRRARRAVRNRAALARSERTVASGAGLTSSGRCPSCNREATFVAANDWLRDHFVCLSCGSIPRERAVMLTIERMFPEWRQSRVHESSPAPRATSKRLRDEVAEYIPSQYFSDGRPDEWRDGVMHQDLENLTFADESIDLHVSQDVLEHVFDPARVFQEVARTLRPGGMHIFTTPLVRKAEPSRRRARLTPDGVEHLLPAEYHGNPISDEGSLVTFDWGFDIVDLIYRASLMPTRMVIIDDLSHGIRAEYIEVLVMVKPGPGQPDL